MLLREAMTPTGTTLVFIQSAALATGFYLMFESYKRRGWLYRNRRFVGAAAILMPVAGVLVLAFGF